MWYQNYKLNISCADLEEGSDGSGPTSPSPRKIQISLKNILDPHIGLMQNVCKKKFPTPLFPKHCAFIKPLSFCIF